MKHEVNLDDFMSWKNEKTVEYASVVGGGGSRSLECNLVGGILVRYSGKVVWEGVQPFTAVEFYNSIDEKIEKGEL